MFLFTSAVIRIDSHFLIKITDFGLSEDVFLRNYYREQADGEMTKLPVKWMAPESLSDGHFSEKSDVVGMFLEYLASLVLGLPSTREELSESSAYFMLIQKSTRE